MKNTLRGRISVLLASVCLISGMLFLREVSHHQAADRAYDAAQQLAVPRAEETAPEAPPEAAVEPAPEPSVPDLPVPLAAEPEPAPLEENARFLLETDLDTLRQTSKNVLGWIYIPDTPVDYPLMVFDNNQTGLSQAWDGSKNVAGCIFLECRNRRDLSDFNTLIYGHYTSRGTMFGSLKYYKEPDYAQAHPFIYIVTDTAVRRYEVFSAYEAGVTSDTYRLYFKDDTQKQAALDEYLDCSVLETDRSLSPEDHILTLSTCTGTGTYDTRWVVQAVLTGEFAR